MRLFHKAWQHKVLTRSGMWKGECCDPGHKYRYSRHLVYCLWWPYWRYLLHLSIPRLLNASVINEKIIICRALIMGLFSATSYQKTVRTNVIPTPHYYKHTVLCYLLRCCCESIDANVVITQQKGFMGWLSSSLVCCSSIWKNRSWCQNKPTKKTQVTRRIW